MFKKAGIPLIIIAASILGFVLLNASKPETKASPKPEKSWLVEAVDVQFQDVAPELTLYGRVETPRDANLKAAVEADVVGVEVLEGETVTAGQLLIQLDDTDVDLVRQQRQADVAEAMAAIDSENQRFKRDKGLLANQQELVSLSEKAVNRAEKLEKTRLASQAALDESRAAYQQQLLSLKQLQHDIDEHSARLAQLKAAQIRAQALLEQSKVNLQRTQIRAPFSGRVAGLNVALGDRVRPGDSMLTVYDLQNLEVRAQIPGRYIARVRHMLGQGQVPRAVATLDNETIQLALHRLSGEVRQDSGGIDGLFRITDNHESLPLGTFVEMQMQLPLESHVIKVPYSALYGLDKVFLIEDGVLKSVSVERIGEMTDKDGQSQLLIRSDALAAGDKIAATQLPNAITGLRVEIAGD